MKFIQYTVTKL